MRGLLSVLLVVACSAVLTAGASADNGIGVQPASRPATDGFRSETDRQAAEGSANGPPERAPVAQAGRANPNSYLDRAEPGEGATAQPPTAASAPTAEGVLTDSLCLLLQSAAAANGLPLEFFARVIWQESRFQPHVVGPMTRGGHRAQGIAQFMPYTAAMRGLRDPFDPDTALPEAAEYLAELRSEFGNLGLAAAAYNAGPGRVRTFIGRRGGLPAQTHQYVRATTGRLVEEWAALGREGGKDGIPKPTSCPQLASLLKEPPNFSIGTVERKVREAALRPQGVPDWPNASSDQSGASRVAARANGNLVPRIRTPQIPIPKPNAFSKGFESVSTRPAAGRLIGPASRAAFASFMPPMPRAAPSRKGFSPGARDHAARRQATARPAESAALVLDRNTQASSGSLPRTKETTPKPIPSGDSRSWSGMPAQSAKARSGSHGSDRLREPSPEEAVRAADERIRRI